MRREFEPLRRSLATQPAPRRWFFRDDDAGWEDRRLHALVEVFRSHDVHVDLAAIPAAVSPALGQRLARLVDDGTLSVHQHGFSHANHQCTARKSEFGSDRAREAQDEDIVRGRELLAERIEGRVEPIFTPPWNRCTDVTAEVLVERGFAAISADSTAPPHRLPGLIEIPVTIDWTRSFARGGVSALAEDLTDAVQGSGAHPIGLMLHHAVMSSDELRALADLLSLLGTSPAATTSLGALLDENSLTSVSPIGHGRPQA